MSVPSEKLVLPAYVSYPSFIKFINGLRETHIPLQIDKSLMPTASGGQVSAMLAALRFLRLIDANGKPNDRMRQLVEAADEARKPILKSITESAYDFLFGDESFPLAKASGQQVAEKFRAQSLAGSTVAKAISFFLSLAKGCDIAVSPHVKPPIIIARASPKRSNGRSSVVEDSGGEDEVRDVNEVQKFQIPIPGKPNAIFIIPRDLSQDEWAMLKTMLDAYVALLQKQTGQ
jgi:hypothetical protein